MTEAPKLPPCPFCGGKARTYAHNGSPHATCAGAFRECVGTDVDAPVAMWSRRAALPTPPYDVSGGEIKRLREALSNLVEAVENWASAENVAPPEWPDSEIEACLIGAAYAGQAALVSAPQEQTEG